MESNYRRCVACHKIAHKREFWRIVRVHPSQQVQVNQGSGRSAYICPQEDCLKTAQKKNRLGRSLKCAVPDSIYSELWERLQRYVPDSKS
jgi:predicted RNA-binding protein YlxR (DUF448 family)